MCYFSNIEQRSCLKSGVKITVFGHFSIKGKCGAIMEVNTIYWEYFYFVVVMCQNTGGMVPFCFCGAFLYLW